jgi:hypothetical protein
MSLLRLSLLALAASALAAGAASAESAADTAGARPEAVPSVHQAAAGVSARPLGDDALQGLSGGQAVAINEQQLKSMTTDNSVNAAGSITNGPVSLSAGAFSGFSGLGNFVINTGNNNTLQGSMSVNITMTPAP